MGGYGSGRWRSLRVKHTVEEGLYFKLGEYLKRLLCENKEGSGSTTWTNWQGEKTASIRWELKYQDAMWNLCLNYRLQREGQWRNLKEYVFLESTILPRGGLRWWFLCPLVVNGQSCFKRVGKLYLPYHQDYFGCRSCYNLTYESCQDSHKYDRFFAYMAMETGFSLSEIKKALKF